MGELLLALVIITTILAYLYVDYIKNKKRELNKRNLYYNKDLLYSNKKKEKAYYSSFNSNVKLNESVINDNRYDKSIIKDVSLIS